MRRTALLLAMLLLTLSVFGQAALAAPTDDLDRDGYTVEGGDCDDSNAWVNPGAEKIPGNGVDEDCDGDIDEALDPDDDGDGVPASEDCDDADDTVHPGARELTDGKDNDCDGVMG